jgi:hypothetical protein
MRSMTVTQDPGLRDKAPGVAIPECVTKHVATPASTTRVCCSLLERVCRAAVPSLHACVPGITNINPNMCPSVQTLTVGKTIEKLDYSNELAHETRYIALGHEDNFWKNATTQRNHP